MKSFGSLRANPFSRNNRNQTQTQKRLPSQCENCIQALRQIIACDNCFSTLGHNLVKMLMSQLSRSFDPCNAPKMRKNSGSEYNPTQATFDHNREPSKLKLIKLGTSQAEENLEISTVDKYETLKVVPSPFGNSEILDIDRSFMSIDDLSAKTTSFRPTKSLNLDAEKIHRVKKNSAFGKHKYKLRVVNQIMKKRSKKSLLSKKQAIKKSIGLLKQGLMKKLLTGSNDSTNKQKNLLVLANKSKKKTDSNVLSKNIVQAKDVLELKKNEVRA
ncbi:unnamed protein product [Moneuplotes crassus]|uniref:Uncharacterized protein n=1 Tax=Euplotes crassus TaxID=5936 RepID=A0AAD1UJL7_EUPCR|nr:unnamed protein product [Moneuplotes crassus]